MNAKRRFSCRPSAFIITLASHSLYLYVAQNLRLQLWTANTFATRSGWITFKQSRCLRSSGWTISRSMWILQHQHLSWWRSFALWLRRLFQWDLGKSGRKVYVSGRLLSWKSVSFIALYYLKNTHVLFSFTPFPPSCGDRIHYLQTVHGGALSQREACETVASQFLGSCGPCHPRKCLRWGLSHPTFKRKFPCLTPMFTAREMWRENAPLLWL